MSVPPVWTKLQSHAGHSLAPDRWQNIHCPAHDDRDESLGVRLFTETNSVGIKCHAGCEKPDVMAALGLKMSDLFEPRQNGDRSVPKKEVAAYNYCDVSGTLLYQNVRYEPKDFRARRPDGAGGWIYNLEGVTRVVYRQPEIQGKPAVAWTEGEKDADALWAIGLPATTSSSSTSWKPDMAQQLVKAGVQRLAILPDNDDAGRKHAGIVARDCHAAGIEVKVVALPGVPAKGDVSDWLAAGGTRDALCALVKDAVRWQPNRETTESEPTATTPAPEAVAALEERAREILALDDPLVAVRAAIRAQGYGGSLDPPLIVYIAMTTRLLAPRVGSSPCHLLIIATSGAGKTYTETLVCRFLPESAVHKLMAGSARALIYDTGELRHKTLLFAEADSLPSDEDNPAASAVRALLQDNELSYDVVVKEPKGKGFITQKIRRPGPTQFITTSTRRFRDHQMATRVFELEIPTDAQKIRAALKVQAHLTNHPAAAPSQMLIDFQAYLQQLAPWDVRVPFAGALAALIGQRQHDPRVLRDFSKLLALVKAVAVIRHARRERDGQCVIASLADYATVRDLVGSMYEAAVTGAIDGVRQVVEAVGQGARTTSDVVSALAASSGEPPARGSVARWISTALAREWLKNDEPNPKRPKLLSVGEPIPDRVLLPTAEDVERASVSLPAALPEGKARKDEKANDDKTYSDYVASSGKGPGSETDFSLINTNNGLGGLTRVLTDQGQTGSETASETENGHRAGSETASETARETKGKWSKDLVPVSAVAFCGACQRFRCVCQTPEIASLSA